MDKGPLINFLRNITELSGGFISALEAGLQLEFYKPHQILHAAGHLENRLYFINSGFARNYYFDHSGNEHTVKFWEAGDLLFSYEGYYHVSSYFYTELLGEAELVTLSYDNLHELGRKFPEVALLIKVFLLNHQKAEYEKQALLALPARDRYLRYRKGNPAIFQKTPIRIIASYLNMTRETLTRLIGRS